MPAPSEWEPAWLDPSPLEDGALGGAGVPLPQRPPHPVLEVIARRRELLTQIPEPYAANSPNRRGDAGIGDRFGDGARLALVLEGGSTRGAYSTGMVTALEQLGLTECFDAVYACSSGSLAAASLLTGHANESVHAWWDRAIMSRVVNPRNPLRGTPVVDTRFLVHEVYERLAPIDFDAILDSPVPFHPLATDADTGESVDLYPLVHDRETLQLALRATTCLPVLAGPAIELGGRRFLDAGLTESLPVHTALAHGATHVLALRTRRHGEPLKPSAAVSREVVRRYLQRRAPAVVDAWLGRHAQQVTEERTLEEHPCALQIRPRAQAPTIRTVEQDTERLRAAVQLGREAVFDTFLGVSGQALSRLANEK